MQQRQPRLGDILDDYCPRERRLTNHAVVAMIGGDVKQTRCTTCDAEHEYKHARVPRQRRKADTPPALYAQVAAGAPKRVRHDEPDGPAQDFDEPMIEPSEPLQEPPSPAVAPEGEQRAAEASLEEAGEESTDAGEDPEREEGPVHRPLIRASLPRPDGQAPPARPAPDFTIRQPGGRPNRFRPRHQRSGQQFQGNRSNGNFGGPQRGRPPQNAMSPRGGRRNGPQGRKRSK